MMDQKCPRRVVGCTTLVAAWCLALVLLHCAPRVSAQRLSLRHYDVAERGSLDFRHPNWVSSDENLANMEEVPGRTFRDNYLIVRLNFETKGTYLMTFTVTSKDVWLGARSEFVIDVNGTRKTFLVKKTAEWQHLNMIVEVAKPGEYSSFLYPQADPKETILWWFRSCDVTIWKK